MHWIRCRQTLKSKQLKQSFFPYTITHRHAHILILSRLVSSRLNIDENDLLSTFNYMYALPSTFIQQHFKLKFSITQ